MSSPESKLENIEESASTKADISNSHEQPGALEKIFGNNGKRFDRISPAHLLHTLPPGYPLSMAIGYMLDFLAELADRLQEAEQELTVVEDIIVIQIPLLASLKKQYLQTKSQQAKALFKFRYKNQLASIEREIENAVNRLELSYSSPNTADSPEDVVNRHVRSINLTKQNNNEKIETLKRDLNLYQTRCKELINQYLVELEHVPPDCVSILLSNEEISKFHSRVMEAHQSILATTTQTE